jgi:hypothetical protein
MPDQAPRVPSLFCQFTDILLTRHFLNFLIFGSFMTVVIMAIGIITSKVDMRDMKQTYLLNGTEVVPIPGSGVVGRREEFHNGGGRGNNVIEGFGLVVIVISGLLLGTLIGA